MSSIITIKVGIKNINNKRIEIVKNLFNNLKDKIKNKFNFNYKIDDFELLKTEFDETTISFFENQEQKAVTEFTKGIILINDSFFDTFEINQKSVIIHEIGHIANKPRDLFINKNKFNSNLIIKHIYAEYLADKFLFGIDKNIFNVGRVEADINTMDINESVQNSINKEAVIKGKFLVIGRLYYYYNFYTYEPITTKINDLITLIREYFSNINHILQNLKNLYIEFESKSDQELIDLLDRINLDIINLNPELGKLARR